MASASEFKEEEAQVVLITGCSSGGIGSALAVAFADRGCQVVATSRSLESMHTLQNHPHVTTCALDVTVDESIAAAVEFVLEKYGRIDILVNNAGVHCTAPVAELPLSLLESTFATNVFGPLKLIQAVTPHFVVKGRGKIVNLGSIAGFAFGPWVGGYSASKVAIHALTDALRIELKPFGIDVVLVVPGAIQSNIGANSTSIFNRLPPFKIYQPFEASLRARAVLSQHSGSTPRLELAQKTVDAILQKKPPRCFLYGCFSTLYALLYYAPLWLRDWYFLRASGISSVSLKKNV
ncbi:hypothetical protein O6H91_02G062000 [Diphasiastrum complanatum]|uniref:Uncharacterized protein n=1 Tax=Diphasiastrum complanatum TaxID=34168 RepID=A0ACC2EG31_DIPCM|nr:hypothetical protein O6H91_02G062000 [Diphasiastrum complanatum]